MSVFDKLERALERLVEGRLLGGARARVHPVEIARLLAQRMQADRRIGLGRTYVPNVFDAGLHPHDHAPLAPIDQDVADEIAAHLERLVKDRGYATSGPIRVFLHEDGDVAEGRIEVSARFEKLEFAQASAPAPVAPPPAASPPGARAILLGNGGFVEGKVIPLKADTLLLGRSPECAIHVPDAQVSKAHAHLHWNGFTYVLRSAGRNGTWVNGSRVENEAVLRHGDEIRVGASSLHFRLMPGS